MPRIPALLAALAIGVARAHDAESAGNGDTVTWTPLAAIQTCLGLTNRTRLPDGIAFSNATRSISLFAGRRTAVLDGASVWLQASPRDASTNDLRDVARADYETLLQPILLATSVPPARLRIVLDAGHGGDDTGARSTAPDVREKDVALDIVRLVVRV